MDVVRSTFAAIPKGGATVQLRIPLANTQGSDSLRAGPLPSPLLGTLMGQLPHTLNHLSRAPDSLLFRRHKKKPGMITGTTKGLSKAAFTGWSFSKQKQFNSPLFITPESRLGLLVSTAAATTHLTRGLWLPSLCPRPLQPQALVGNVVFFALLGCAAFCCDKRIKQQPKTIKSPAGLGQRAI